MGETKVDFSYLLNLTINEFKAQFKKLLKTHHPDKGGSEEVMKQLNAIKEAFVKGKVHTAREERNAREASADYKGKPTPYADASEWDAKLRDAILKILDMDNVRLELIGTWLWIDGETRPHKEFLKANGFKFMVKENVPYWYFGQTGRPRRGFKPMKQDDVRKFHGVKHFQKEGALVK